MNNLTTEDTESTEIIWKRADRELPDSEQAMLVHLPDGEVWTGFLDADPWGTCWRYVSGEKIEGGVIHWAHFPKPPEGGK